jgi:hypothetical protein
MGVYKSQPGQITGSLEVPFWNAQTYVFLGDKDLMPFAEQYQIEINNSFLQTFTLSFSQRSVFRLTPSGTLHAFNQTQSGRRWPLGHLNRLGSFWEYFGKKSLQLLC